MSEIPEWAIRKSRELMDQIDSDPGNPNLARSVARALVEQMDESCKAVWSVKGPQEGTDFVADEFTLHLATSAIRERCRAAAEAREGIDPNGLPR